MTEEAPLAIGVVARAYGVTVDTIREWDSLGKLKSFRTEGGQRRYRLSENPDLAAKVFASSPD